MAELAFTEDQIHQFKILNSVIESAEPNFSKIFTYDNFINEINTIDLSESVIPEDAFFDLHLTMILSEGQEGLRQYYSSMSAGTNRILEAARSIFPDSPEITESIDTFRSYLGSLLVNEDVASEFDVAVAGGPAKPRKSKGFWATIKDVMSALTEGGSAIGIIQFIIDILGLVGDFILPGLGSLFDVLNAIIYLIRGKYLMAMISLIAAILIGGGDAFKLLKVWAKPSERIAVALLKEGGSKVAAKELSELSAKESGGVLKLLTYIFGNIGGVLGKATTMVGILIKKFGNITKWVPGLGGMLKWVFDLMGDTLTKFGNMVSLGSANLKLATAAAKKSAAMSIDSAVKAGGDFVVDGSWIKVIGKDGKTLGRYPAKQFDKISAESLANLATKKAGEKEAAKILYKNGDDLADVSRVLTDPKVQLSTRKAIYKFFGTTPFEAGFKRALGKRLYYFIGKTIYALIFGTDWVEGGQNKWSKREVEGHGNGAMNAWIADRIKKQRAESGATYIPAVMLDSRDQEVYDQITDYQNHFAKELDQPTIMQVVTNKYDKQETPDEVADFFKQIEEGEVTRGGEGDRVSHEDADSTSTIQRMEESRKPLVRKILNFSDFNNGTKGL